MYSLVVLNIFALFSKCKLIVLKWSYGRMKWTQYVTCEHVKKMGLILKWNQRRRRGI